MNQHYLENYQLCSNYFWFYHIKNMIEQLRKYRIGGIALFDLITSMIGTVLLLLLARSIHHSQKPIRNYVLAGILLAVPLGIFVHVLIGKNTTLNYKLGLSDKPS
jgi:hypothetical protein